MQPFLSGTGDNLSLTDFQLQTSLIDTIKHRFHTYGYQQTRTGTFQDYELYASMTGTVRKRDMIKTIDPSGDVLVLRPDVTIPITRKMASEKERHHRLFYVENVFRQPSSGSQHQEFTQAGVECFGENSPENDAELIAMAVHLLNDLSFDQFKVEISHAGFFKELIDELPLSAEESVKLQRLIQSKNLAEIGPFLDRLPAEAETVEAVKAIPLLYGNPQTVMDHAAAIALNDSMQQTIDELKQVYAVLNAYGVADSVVFDLGLINHMTYYSGIIFQGYVTSSSKPVLMGGRYNDLAEQFGQKTPAIGFGCIIDFLFEALKAAGQEPAMHHPAELIMSYEPDRMTDALKAASTLRNKGFCVMTQHSERRPIDHDVPAAFTVYYEADRTTLCHEQNQVAFQGTDELLSLLQEMRETK
ncbi:ATP phosphoribosyltransferase regulatory subunit [Lentibacillus salinarum]|uniref:ATP phosphoribosyltransferase regulatory subunit n=1 Tax=Lentibacillus salinarum TaxID=446820 RepID=A0ABW3ZS27_9BACI